MSQYSVRSHKYVESFGITIIMPQIRYFTNVKESENICNFSGFGFTFFMLFIVVIKFVQE